MPQNCSLFICIRQCICVFVVVFLFGLVWELFAFGYEFEIPMISSDIPSKLTNVVLSRISNKTNIFETLHFSHQLAYCNLSVKLNHRKCHYSLIWMATLTLLQMKYDFSHLYFHTWLGVEYKCCSSKIIPDMSLMKF